MVRSAPKDHQRRSVPFPPLLADLLAARMAGRDTDGPMFRSRRGGVLRVRNMSRDWFDAAAVTAGVPGFSPHELRHTAASLAVSAGASVLGCSGCSGTTRRAPRWTCTQTCSTRTSRRWPTGWWTPARVVADSLRTETVVELPTGVVTGR